MPCKMIVLSAMIIWLLAVGCKNADSKTEDNNAAITTKTEATAVGDNTRNSVDWAGIYKGIIPCADCDGIETSLQLNRDNTYLLTTKYLGKADATTLEAKGNFSWDAGGSVITLQGITEGPVQYKVGEDMVIQYDPQGKEIISDLVDQYTLRK